MMDEEILLKSRDYAQWTRACTGELTSMAMENGMCCSHNIYGTHECVWFQESIQTSKTEYIVTAAMIQASNVNRDAMNIYPLDVWKMFASLERV